jgi:uncharacterized damage-inducible protein DinB
MKSYFIRLLKYDHFANKKIADLLIQTAAVGKPLELMAHLLTAQQTWLKRLQADPAPMTPLWPVWSIKEALDTIDSNYNDLLFYLETLQPQDFEQVLSYRNSAGDFENTITDILAHLFNHGTHHRAQIGTLLKLEGANLPPLDYVLYVRSLNRTDNNNN